VKIINLRKEIREGFSRVTATVIWEDVNRINQDISFSTREELRDSFSLNPDAFLIACCLPAMYVGEKRIKIEGYICPKVKDGLKQNMEIFRHWYGRNRYFPIAIEADIRKSSLTQNSNKHVGLFFSGGIDSLFSLRTNRLAYSLNHEASIKDCFLVYGFDMPFSEEIDENSAIFKRAYEKAKIVTDDASANLIPIYTNIRKLDQGLGAKFWPNWYHGAALASVAHCFTPRLKAIHIASTNAIENNEPWGSHPDIDPNYSSNELKIIHDDLCPKFEKLKIISDWEVAFQNIRTCYQNHEELLNCCACKKCFKVMIMLTALNKLAASRAFPIHEISVEQLKLLLWDQKEADFKVNFKVLIPFLKKYGQNQLARIIVDECSFKARLRRFDIEFWNGRLTKFSAFLQNVFFRKRPEVSSC